MTAPGLREVLADPGGRVLATFVLIPRVEIVEALAVAGFDAVVLDLEHGPFTVHELPALVAAATGAGLHTIVRVSHGDAATIGSVLDVGIDGVLVPHVTSAGDAASIVDACRFPPDGSRSVNPYVRSARYSAGEGYLEAQNRRVAVIVMVEGSAGLTHASEIAGVPGIDAVFVGPVDLSAALGVPGQPEHPKVVKRVRALLGELASAGAATGIYAPTPDAALRWQALGVPFVALSVDIAMAMEGFRSFRGRV